MQSRLRYGAPPLSGEITDEESLPVSRRGPRTIALALLGALLLVPAARADTEPNDVFTQASGPLLGGPVTGAIATDNDVDWYSFYANGQQQIEITGTVTPGNCRLHVSLHDADVFSITSDDASTGSPAVIRYSTPAGVNRFYLRIASCAGERYTLAITPAGALTGGEGITPVTATGEPNESAEQAFGPLAGGIVYGGAIDTINDKDWFYAFTLAPAAIEVELRNPEASGCNAYVNLYDGAGKWLEDAKAESAHIGRLRYTLPSAGRWQFEVASCNGTRYELRLTPANVFSLTPPPQPAPPIVEPEDTRPLPEVALTGSGTSTSARIRGRKVRLVIRGRVRLPAGTSAAQACSGRVALTIKTGRRLLSARNATLRRDCRFSKTINLSRGKVGSARSLRVTARFQGNGILKPHARTFTVRVRR